MTALEQRPDQMATTDAEAHALTARRYEKMRPLAGSPTPVDLDGLPPGPRWPAIIQSIGLLRFRHQFVPWAHRRYGDAFTVRILPQGRPLVLFTRPEHAREIFAGDPEVFHAGKGNAILGPMMGEHSLLLQDSSEHKRARKLLMPAFNGHALREYADLVTDVATAEVASWLPGESFSALRRMNRLTLEVILRVVFGVTDEARLAEMRPRVNKVVDISPAILFGYGMPRLQKLGPWKRSKDNAFELDALIYAEIRERRAAADLDSRTDVLSRLIRVGTEGGSTDDRLTDEELRDQLITLLLAGHETTATALAWALYELGRSPALLERSRAAAVEGDDDWLEAVLKESMRLHPVIPMVVRTLMKPASIGGHDLPAGTTVGPSIIIAHSRPDNHESPSEFRPERFIEGQPATNTWIPFGGGVRRCIGAGFSLMEGVVVLREVLSTYAVESMGEDKPKVRNITSVPRDGATIRITR
ncbi:MULTISPECIES: cytochrome P450 [Nocardioides]|uniref:cytochrome P450 n=1 Tax=Nocardioides TaxID=1839 RepID=UPI00032F2110|nr:MULTISPECIES: cytochrome P450 [Nocardioides]EON22642.1 cytochrome P450 [Nocardioides sp. CF8]